MSVTTTTLAVKRSAFFGSKQWLYTFRYQSTGDGSGGSILVSDTNMATYLPQYYVAEIINAQMWHNSASNYNYSMDVIPGEWENWYGSIIGSIPESELTGCDSAATVLYMAGQQNLLIPLPWYLGKPLTSTPAVRFNFDTNVNTKTYTAILSLRITPIS